MKTRIIEEKKIVTKDIRTREANGWLVSLWKDWEGFFKVEPRQIYLNVIGQKGIKGPHLHKNRWDYFVCIKGQIRFIVKWGQQYEEIEANAERDPCFKIVEIPPAVSCAIQNIGPGETWFINMPNPAWHPDHPDDHPVKFDGYVWRDL